MEGRLRHVVRKVEVESGVFVDVVNPSMSDEEVLYLYNRAKYDDVQIKST